MRLLLTRAEDDAARTRARLEAGGHEVVVAPVIRIVPLAASWPTGTVDAVAATSAHAFATWRDSAFPARETRRLVPLLLVGARTREAAWRSGFRGMATVANDAGELGVLLPSLAHVPRHVAYLAGRDRRPDLERALHDLHAASSGRTTVVECYAAEPTGVFAPEVGRALRHGDGVLHYSRRSAELFLAAANDFAAARLRHFALSPEVAAPLHEAGCADVLVASAPNEAALLALLGSPAGEPNPSLGPT